MVKEPEIVNAVKQWAYPLHSKADLTPLFDRIGDARIVMLGEASHGNTILSIISVLRKGNPGKIIIAVPVSSRHAVEKIAGAVDKIITLLIPELFMGVGSFYEDFSQVSDEEVLFYLDKLYGLGKVA